MFDASAGASVEKNFDLGKTDTASSLCAVVGDDRMQFSLPTRNRNRIRDMRENIDFIRAFDGCANLRDAARMSRVSVLRAMSQHCGVGAKQGRFCGRVHRPLSGVGVFSVALV